jgi:shikimate dehydrogenase
VDAEYVNFEIPDVKEVENIFKQPIAGLNVTIPYKESIIPFLDEVTEEATKIGAVNVIECKDGKKIGHNTDVYGFQQSIKPFLTNKHERALLLGTGGASKAVAFVFNNIGIDVIFCTRNPKKSNEFPYSAMNEHMVNACKVIVNCTPVGTFPNIDEHIAFPFEHLTDEHLVVDLIYNPSTTKFLFFAKQNGATILNGESMLKEQALKAWEIWNQI